MLPNVYFQVDAIQVEMQKDVRKKAVFEKCLLLCAKTETELLLLLFQEYKEFAEKLGEAIFNFYTTHYTNI